MKTHPDDSNFVKVKISKDEHNTIFKYRKRKWYSWLTKSFQYWRYNDTLWIEEFCALPWKLLMTILLPFVVILIGIPKAFDEYRYMWFQRKYNTYIVDEFHYHK